MKYTHKLLAGLFLFFAFAVNAQTAECIQDECVPFPFMTNNECPLEICIVQSIECPGEAPVGTLTCSTIEHIHPPDPYSMLCYKKVICAGCTITTMQVDVKRIATGETITLMGPNAQLFTDIVSGQTQQQLMIGMFTKDCEGRPVTNPVTLWLFSQNLGNGMNAYMMEY